MANTYTSNVKLAKPAAADTGWDDPLNDNADALDALSPVGGLAVSLMEVPSTSLNVRVAAGTYRGPNGSLSTYAGTSSQAITTATTKVVYLDSSGTLTVGASYPTNAYHVPLATVVAGATTITSVTDNRVAGGHVLYTLGNYANDAAAAGGSIPVGGLYRNGSIVMVRVT